MHFLDAVVLHSVGHPRLYQEDEAVEGDLVSVDPEQRDVNNHVVRPNESLCCTGMSASFLIPMLMSTSSRPLSVP